MNDLSLEQQQKSLQWRLTNGFEWDYQERAKARSKL